MAGIPKNHSSLYFDALCRTQKGETVLSLIHATYHAKNARVTQGNIKVEIAQRLEYAYRLYRDNVRGSDNGAGSYHGDVGQFDSQYTIGHEVGIWKNSQLDLSPLAEQVANNMITIREYFDIVFLNYFQPVNNKVVHMLHGILTYMIQNNIESINKADLPEVYGVTIESEKINAACNFLDVTTYFKYTGTEIKYTGEYSKEQLLSYCNTKYVGEGGYEKALEEINTDAKYVEYITKDTRVTQISNQNESNIIQYENSSLVPYAHNRIIFGAPGTGKSYKLEKERKIYFENRYERVTFHPNYSYSQFVGTYKPIPCKDSEGKDSITYDYVAGPFLRVLVEAMRSNKNNQSQSYLLLIEEINRANVAAVFGDVFQLLDRKNGLSEYEIETSEDMRKYLQKELKGDISEYKRIVIPSVFIIWATMNSADQGVFPIDTAFKRRWDFEYIGIDDNKEEMQDILIKLGQDSHYVCWNELREKINSILSNECRVNEDKLLGPYFISKSIIEADGSSRVIKNNEYFLKVFESKVIMYLYDDAAKQKRSTIFAGCSDVSTYSKVCAEFRKKGEAIFEKDLNLEVNLQTGVE